MQVLVGGPCDGKAIQDSMERVVVVANWLRRELNTFDISEDGVYHAPAGTREEYHLESLLIGTAEIFYRRHRDTTVVEATLLLFQWYSGKKKLREEFSDKFIEKVVGKDYATKIHTAYCPSLPY